MKKNKFFRYINFRLGNKSIFEKMINMFKRSFGATSIREFWLCWNPFCSYFLIRYIFRPAKKLLPVNVAILITFIVSGIIFHDLPIMIFVYLISGIILPFPLTIVFFFLGLMRIFSVKYKCSFKKYKLEIRFIIHSSLILVSFLMSFSICRLIMIYS